MPPRKRQTRMDAAIENLGRLGFAKKVIRKKVNELLKVYDGGWALIEEDSYRVLIEYILDNQEKDLLQIDAGTVNEKTLVIGEPSDAGTSKQVDRLDEPTYSEPGKEELKDVLEDNGCPPLPSTEESLEEKLCSIVNSANKHRGFVSPCVTPSKVAEIRRRKPCFGFLDSDDDEDDDFIYPVTQASLNMTQNYPSSGRVSISRWDVVRHTM